MLRKRIYLYERGTVEAMSTVVKGMESMHTHINRLLTQSLSWIFTSVLVFLVFDE